MYTINHKVQENCIASEGRYLSALEMQPFETYINTYQDRLKIYHLLQAHSNKWVMNVLKKMANKYPTLIRGKGKRCHYDMTATLRYMALSILRDDERFFQDSVVIWLDTVLVAHQKHRQCADAYTNLVEEISEHLQGTELNFIRPYINRIIQIFDSHIH